MITLPTSLEGLTFLDANGTASGQVSSGHDTVNSAVDFRIRRAHIEDLELIGTAQDILIN